MTEQQEARKLWVQALLSGDFDQARGALRKGQAHCCLGVACEVYRKATGNGKWDADGWFLGRMKHLPEEVSEWLGIASVDGLLVEGVSVTSRSLTELNDAGVGFAEIAHLIESGALELDEPIHDTILARLESSPCTKT